MKNRYKVLRTVVVVFIALVLMISGCKKKEEEVTEEKQTSETSSVKEEAPKTEEGSDNETDTDSGDVTDTEIDVNVLGTMEEPPVWEFDISAEYGELESGMPLINPMGSKEAYSEVLYAKDDGYTYRYLNEEGIYGERTVFGESYRLTIPFDSTKSEEDNEAFLKDIVGYAKQMGGNILGYYYDKVIFTVDDEDGYHWWCEALEDDETFVLNIYRENEIRIGETFTINTADYPDEKYYFSSHSDGKTFYTVTAKVETGSYYIDIYNRMNYGEYRKDYNYNQEVNSYKGNVYTLDNVMIDEGAYYWELNWRRDEDPGIMEITLEATGELPYIKMGEELGAIKVSTSVAESISVYPTGQDDLYIDHPEIDSNNFQLDKTPDGDYLIYVPSGMWDVEIVPRGERLLENYRTVLVPVHSGEITTIKVPLQYEQLLSSESKDKGVEGLVMEDLVESNDKVSFNFTLVDREAKEVEPSKENTEIYEGGVKTQILNLERIQTPPSVVLLLDSSGSMKGQMNQTLDAAESFISSLPENTYLKVVDFDSEPKVFEGITIDEGLAVLPQIQARGATALYDTVIKGYEELDGKSRPTLVVFTDGTDANLNDTGPGSDATYDQVLDIVKANDISMYTIGFGEGHDSTVLTDLAQKSGGLYYSAEDDTALENVFEAINNKLNNSFTATYQRPTEVSPSDVPVISFVVDISGSMYSDENDACDFRLDDVKNVFHEFVQELPEDAQLQLMTFNNSVYIEQSSTTDKSRILRAIGEMKAGGGTNIIGSVDAGYRTLDMVPSTNKVLIYLTDAALGVDDDDQDYFDGLLDEMKDKKMNVLWVGLGLDEGSPEFVYAAENSGGEYVTSEDPDVLKAAFDKVLVSVQASEKSEKTNVRINVEKVSETGARTPFTANQFIELPPLPISGQIALTETINYESGGSLKQYDATTAKLITGIDRPGTESTILKRMPVDVADQNTAMEIQVDELIYMSKLKGVEAPSRHRYLAVDLNIKHILPKQEVVVYPEGTGHPASWVGGGNANEGTVKNVKIPYMIPDYKSHFFVTYNEEGTYPASKVTWLANNPITAPGNQSIMLAPDQSEDGVLIFVVPDEGMEQCSLHFYDVDYGHIDIPLVGIMQKHDVDITQLPKTQTTKLNDVFDLSIEGYSDTYTVLGEEEAEEGGMYRVVEGNFVSKVQALIDINPSERFLMRFPTESGAYYVPLSPITSVIPAGFAQPRMMAPGSFNYVRWAFNIPEGLESNTSEIYMDLADGDGRALIEKGTEQSASPIGTYSHEYFDVIVNSVSSVEEVVGRSGNWVVADITIADIEDDYATSGIGELFYMVKKGYDINAGVEKEQSPNLSGGGLSGFASSTEDDVNILSPHSNTESVILGIDDDRIIYDGTSLRGQVIFKLGYEDEVTDWVFESPLFEDMSIEVGDSSYDESLFALEEDFFFNDSYSEKLEAAISEVVMAYQATHPEEDESLMGNGNLGEEVQQHVPAPAISSYGQELLEALDSDEAVWRLIRSLEYTAIDDSNFTRYQMSPEGVVSQNSGTAQEMAKLAYDSLCRLGYKPTLRPAELTDKGKEEHLEMSGYDYLSVYRVPLIEYKNDAGEVRRMVLPFVKDLSELNGIAFIEEFESETFDTSNVSITVNLIGEPSGGSVLDHMGDVANALGGGGETDPTETREIYSEFMDADIFSKGAADIIMAKEGNNLTAVLTTVEGNHKGEDSVDLLSFDVEMIEVIVRMPGESEWIHRVAIEEGKAPENVFMTLSLGAPGITTTAAKVLEDKYQDLHKQIEDPSSLTAMQWYTRSMLNNYIYQQTMVEDEFEATYGIVSNHVLTERGVAITLHMDGDLRTSIDILESKPDLYIDNDEIKESYRIVHGMTMSKIEEDVVQNGYGLYGIWTAMPEGGNILLMDSSDDERITDEDLLNLGMRESMIAYLRDTDKFILIQTKPSMLDGQERWAWYEIDQYSYETISVLDTGEHGAMSTQSILQTEVGAAQFLVGAFKGIETSVWSVSAFSLQLSDYDEILKQAKAFALGVGENFKVPDLKDMAKDAAKDYAKKTGSQMMDDIGGDGTAKGFLDYLNGLDGPPSKDDYLGFQNGFKAGVNYYFDNAK